MPRNKVTGKFGDVGKITIDVWLHWQDFERVHYLEMEPVGIKTPRRFSD